MALHNIETSSEFCYVWLCGIKKKYILNSFEEKVKSILTEKYLNIYQYREILEISVILTTTKKAIRDAIKTLIINYPLTRYWLANFFKQTNIELVRYYVTNKTNLIIQSSKVRYEFTLAEPHILISSPHICSLHAAASPGFPAARRSRQWWWRLHEIWSGSFGTALRSGGGWSWGPRRPAAARSQASTTRWTQPSAPPSELWPESKRLNIVFNRGYINTCQYFWKIMHQCNHNDIISDQSDISLECMFVSG